MRYDWFELAVMHDLGFYVQLDANDAVQPLGRTCLDVGAATPRTDLAFHAGIRGCAGTVYTTFAQSGFLIDTAPRPNISGGGYAALSFALASWIRLFVRADVDVGWTQLSGRDSVFVLPALSTFLSFE